MEQIRAQRHRSSARFGTDWRGGEGDSSAAGVLVLTTDGLIAQCDAGLETLFGYPPDALIGHPIGLLLPEIADEPLVSADGAGVDPRFAYRCRCGSYFRALRADGSAFGALLCIHPVRPSGTTLLRVHVRRAEAAEGAIAY